MNVTPFDELVSPLGPVYAVDARSSYWTPKRRKAAFASVGSGYPGYGCANRHHIKGAGSALDSASQAKLVAIAEAAERYAAADILGEHRIWATASDLGDTCLEPFRYPRCSDEEYAQRGCPVRRFDPHTPIRWVRGLDLLDGEPIWLPAAMATYRLHRTHGDDFPLRISTGYAVHTDPVEATLRGIFEVIERDILAVLWLQRLPLPLINPATRSQELSYLVDWCERRFIEVFLFDATSDLGIPTVYCLLKAEHDRLAANAVGAGIGRQIEHAAEKSLYEAISVHGLLHDGQHPPETFDNFVQVEDAARYMGRAENAAAFDFLVDGARSRRSVACASLPAEPREALGVVLAALAGAGMRPVVVDRTTRELAGVGLTAVNVVIPDLQPMSPHPLAQFKAHPRLYEVPARMGYRTLTEKELNPWPQPFA